MIDTFHTGMFAASLCIIIAFFSFMKETDDLHRLLLTDLASVMALFLIALVGTDLAEALILPGLVVTISKLMALAEIYLLKEGIWGNQPARALDIEVLQSAPAILASILVIYGIFLSGFSGGAVAGLGIIFYLVCKGHQERFELIETVSGYAWVAWIAAFFIMLIFPSQWFLAVMIAGGAILIKVTAKLSLIGTMRGESDV
jgi:energy-converting hydrogenase A subunit G